MMAWFRTLSPLWAVLPLLLWPLAYASCAMLAAPTPDTICSSHGPAVPHAPAVASMDCPACHQLPALEAAPPPHLTAARITWLIASAGPVSRQPALGPSAPPPQSRAPPTA